MYNNSIEMMKTIRNQIRTFYQGFSQPLDAVRFLPQVIVPFSKLELVLQVLDQKKLKSADNEDLLYEIAKNQCLATMLYICNQINTWKTIYGKTSQDIFMMSTVLHRYDNILSETNKKELNNLIEEDEKIISKIGHEKR